MRIEIAAGAGCMRGAENGLFERRAKRHSERTD